MDDFLFSRIVRAPLSRRQWLRGAAAAGVSVSLPVGLAGSAFAADTPRHGGILVSATTADPANFDPFSNTSSGPLHVVAACYNSLVMMDPQNPGKIIGDLAESWEVSPDGLKVTFHLVKNAKFHDGVPLTSADVKYTFDTVRNPPEKVVSVRKALLSNIAAIETPDPYTVVFDLKQPQQSLLSTLATGWMVVAPKHILERDGDMKKVTIGSGPFMLKGHTRGVSFEMVRNPNYHVPDRPYLDGITFFIVPDLSTTYSYIATGQILFYEGLPPADWVRLRTDHADKVVLHTATTFSADTLIVNGARKPFDDIRVRKAIALSIDHQDAFKVVMEGAGALGGILPSGAWGASESELASIPGYGKNVEANRAEAKKLLAEAGLPSDFRPKVVGRLATGTTAKAAVFVVDQLAKVGIQATVDIQETATYFESLQKRNFDLATYTLGSLSDDPDFVFGPYQTCNGNLNFSGVCSTEADAIFAKQSLTTDPAERAKLVHEMERLALEQYGNIPLYFKAKTAIASTKLKNYVNHSELDNNRRWQNVWIDG